MTTLHGVDSTIEYDSPPPIENIDTNTLVIIDTFDGADDAKFPMHKPIMIKPTDTTLLAALGPSALKDSYLAIQAQVETQVVAIRVPYSADQSEQTTHFVGNATALTGQFAVKKVANILKVDPRIGYCGGTSYFDDNNINPITSQWASIATDLEMIAVVDGPNRTDTAAIAHADLIDSDHIYMIEGYANVYDTVASDYVAKPSGAFVAGLIAQTDERTGLQEFADNKVIKGIGSPARNIAIGQQSDLLNAKGIGVIAEQKGLRLWGARSLSKETNKIFMQSTRIIDYMNIGVRNGVLWAVGKSFGGRAPNQIKQQIRNDNQIAENANLITPGWEVLFLKKDNEQTDIDLGKYVIRNIFAPWGPIEKITIKVIIDTSLRSVIIERLQ